MIQEKTVRDALQVFRHCLDHKGILRMEENAELFELAQDQDISEVLSLLEDEMLKSLQEALEEAKYL